jgi:hypothetical protein
MVWAEGATSLRLIVRMPKKRIRMVAPDAYLMNRRVST